MLSERYDKIKDKFAEDKLHTLTDEELILGQKQMFLDIAYYRVLELTVKRLANSVYGAFGTNSNRYFLQELASDICAEGQFYIKMMDTTQNEYFKGPWGEEVEFVKELKATEWGYIIPDDLIVPRLECLKGKDMCNYIDTDSLHYNSYVNCKDSEPCTIEEFYNRNIPNGSAGTTQAGHESVLTNEKVLNWTEDNRLYYGKVRRIIRHKVRKAKWTLKTKSGKTVTVTNDHSMIVFRDGQKLKVKPAEILKTDKILCVHNKQLYQLYQPYYLFDSIESIEQTGMFEDEYVYDIEMDDDSHTFIADDILVHNSTYARGDLILETLGINPSTAPTTAATRLLEYIYTHKMKPIFDEKLETTITKRHGKNVMDFELELIGGKAINVAKKKYILTMMLSDGNMVADKGWLKSTGIELNQSGSSTKVQSIIKSFLNAVFTKWDSLTDRDFFAMCTTVKNQLREHNNIKDLASNKGINKYKDYVVDDINQVILKPKATPQIKGAARYNYLIHKHKLMYKYPYIKANKVNWYYDKNGDPFAFHPDYYPEEILPEMGFDIQVEKLVFNPIKRLLTGMVKSDIHQMGETHVQMGFAALTKFKK